MKIKLLKPCIINGESLKPAKGKKGEVEVDPKQGRLLVNLGKAEDLTPKDEPLELTLNIDPKELEEIKAQLEQKDAEIAAKDEEIKALTEKVEALEAAQGKGD